MRFSWRISLWLILALLLVAAPYDSRAACSTPRTFSTSQGPDYSYVYTPGFPHANGRSISDNFDAVFWSFGSGDPVVGAGNDSGSFGPFSDVPGPYYGWLYPGGTFGTIF